MKSYLVNHVISLTWKFFVVYVMLIINVMIDTNFSVEVESVYLWGSPIGKMNGNCMIWNPLNTLSLQKEILQTWILFIGSPNNVIYTPHINFNIEYVDNDIGWDIYDELPL